MDKNKGEPVISVKAEDKDKKEEGPTAAPTEEGNKTDTSGKDTKTDVDSKSSEVKKEEEKSTTGMKIFRNRNKYRINCVLDQISDYPILISVIEC